MHTLQTWMLLTLVLCAAAQGAETYPSEQWPSESTVLSLNATTDETTGLPYIADGTGPTSSPTLRVQYDRRLHRQNSILAVLRQGMVVDEGSLKIGVYPIVYYMAGARAYYSGTTNVAVTDNDTNHVWIGDDNMVHVGTSGFPADTTTFLPLAQVATSGGVATVTDERGAVLFEAPDDTSRDGAIDLTADVTGILPVPNGGTGASTLTGVLHGNGASAVTAGDVDLTAEVTGALPVANGGTGATAAAAARTNLSAAASGANSDITSLAGLTTALSVAQGGTALTVANVVPYTPSAYLSGVLSVKVWEIEWVAPVDFTIKNVTGRVNTAPTGAALICDVRVDGNSIFSSQAEMVNIAAAANQDTSATKDHAVTAGEIITFEIEQIGSAVAGSDLTIMLNGRTAFQT